MTQESLHERKTMLAKHVEYNISSKTTKDLNDAYTGKRFRRKPMKCVSIDYDKSKQIEQHSNKGDIDPNNNESSYKSAIHTEVIDIEEERVKDKTNSSKSKTGIKRKKTSLDQLLSKVVAKRDKLEENRVKTETETQLKPEIKQTVNGQIKQSIYNKPYTKDRLYKDSAFTPVVPDRHRSPTSIHHHQQHHSPKYPTRRHFTTTVISPPPPPPPLPPPLPPASVPPQHSDNEEKHHHKKPNKRTMTTNQRYAKLSNTQLQRRLVANARERSRVHALSNAFDALRCTIPSYSTEQKLSKLTILRVAINYIDALTQLLAPSTEDTQERFEKCVDECTAVLQTEYGRSKTK